MTASTLETFQVEMLLGSRLTASRSVRCLMRNLSWTASTNPVEFSTADIGKLYKVEAAISEELNLNKTLPVHYRSQLNTFKECVWMCRAPLLEVINCLKSVNSEKPSLRIVLWGPYGTGKTMTLNQTVHYAHQEQFVVVHIPTVMRWTRMRTPHQLSTHKPGRLDIPLHATEMLQLFKQQNQHVWSKLNELKTEREYAWTKVEKTAAERPVTDIVDMGISAPFTATDCVGALFRELRRHASLKNIKLLVAIDQANSLYGKTKIKKADFTWATSDEVSIVIQTRKFLRNDWRNGACVIVADQAEISDFYDTLTVPLITPRELFGQEVFESIDPFVPIETRHYTKQEADVIFDYYCDKKWITKGNSKEGRLQTFYLSGFNPYNYERLCAFT
ncbi:Deoxyhypusine hydroxylase [Aphelenchoides besseyi]|nr:Deoxyhypusine hydroxylase [Aphelenchoides besseyi]